MGITFETTLYEINAWRILHLPPEASGKLPSRGMVMVRGTMNAVPFTASLEPDGKGSHWFRVPDALSALARAAVGDKVSVFIEVSDDWAEPEVPSDLSTTLQAYGLCALWNSLSPKAQWAWIRWIRSTASAATRKERVERAGDMLRAGKKRPCCFDHSRCTETHVAKSGMLLGHMQ